MNCIDIQDSLVEFLLNELDATERSLVQQHLSSGCRQCNAELHLLTESVELLWKTVPSPDLSVELQKQIVARALDDKPFDSGVEPTIAETRNPFRLALWVRSSAPQAIFAFAAGILFMMMMTRITSPGKPMLEEDGRSHALMGSQQFPALLEISEKGHPSAHFVALRRQPESHERRGYLLWDKLNREIHLYCFGLERPREGKQYALWLVGPAMEVRVVDRLEVAANGVSKAAVHWPEGDFQFAKVTLESTVELNNRPSDTVELITSTFYGGTP